MLTPHPLSPPGILNLQTLVSTNRVSDSMNWTILGTSYKWNLSECSEGPASHPGLLLPLSLPAEDPQDGRDFASSTSTSLFRKEFCLLSTPLFLPCSCSFLPAETDTKGGQPMGCKQTSIREMRRPAHLLIDTPNLYLECTPIGGARLSAVMWKDARENEERRHWFLLHVQLFSSSSVMSKCLRPYGPYPTSSSVLGIFQARIMEWVAISCSRGSSWLRDWTASPASPALAGGQADFSSLHHLAKGKILELLMFLPCKLEWKEWVMAERSLRDSFMSWSRAGLPVIETYLCCSLELLITQTSSAI